MPWSPGEYLLKSIVDCQKASARSGIFWGIRRRWAQARHRVWSVVTNTDIDIRATLSPDLKLPHPIGIVIHPEAKVGQGCMIMQHVTIGQLAADGAPVIGDGVYIGAGAKVLGKIVVGDGAAIGANAVVLQDVPRGFTAVGVPAQVRPSKSRPMNG